MFAVAAYVAWRLFGHVQTRVDDLARPVERPPRLRLPDRPGAVRAVRRRHRRHRPRPRQPGQVPEAQNDFIFTAIGEELGLFGAAAVLMAYLLLIGAGLRTALRTDNTFEKLLAVGLTTILGVQAFIIVGGVIKVVPLTGITLPFVSYGGSSLLSNYILLALLIRLSDSGARRLHELPDDPTPSERWAAYRLRRRSGVDGHGVRADEPPDPPARRRPDGLLRRAVRRPQLLAGRTPAGAQRPRRQHPRHPPRVRAAPRADRHDRRRRRRPVGARTRRAATSRTSASTRPATCSPTSPATTRSPSARPGWSARRTPCSPAAPPSSSCATCRASSPAADTSGIGPHGVAQRPPAGGQGRPRRARGLGRRHRAGDRRGAGDVELPELRPQPHRQPGLRGGPRRAQPSTRTPPATRCWPTPTSSATCRARRSRS